MLMNHIKKFYSKILKFAHLNAFFAHNLVILVQTRFVLFIYIYSCAQETKSLLGHIWAWAWHVVYPIDGVFRATYISKIIIPNKNQILQTPPPPPPPHPPPP